MTNKRKNGPTQFELEAQLKEARQKMKIIQEAEKSAQLLADQFNLEKQWKLYLERCQLPEEKMSVIQRVETKRAFYGGLTQMLVLMREGVSHIESEDKAVLVLEFMNDQCKNFWNAQIKLNKEIETHKPIG